MTRIAMLVGALVLACGGKDEQPNPCEAAAATSIEHNGAQMTCTWQCATLDGKPVVLAWRVYDTSSGGFVLVSEDGFAGVCVD